MDGPHFADLFICQRTLSCPLQAFGYCESCYGHWMRDSESLCSIVWGICLDPFLNTRSLSFFSRCEIFSQKELKPSIVYLRFFFFLMGHISGARNPFENKVSASCLPPEETTIDLTPHQFCNNGKF